ncbi:MAG: hypothetical protein H7061_04935 [Bdellovibrionaceae bacterium]|nr:hypothetical protein [Bdellovibrio sp.]
MKNMILAASVMMSLTGSFAFASRDSRSMKENYATCAHANSSWYQRFGQYVVAFELGEAAAICHARGEDYKSTGCRVNGETLQAGFYCQEWAGGGN